MIRDGVALIVIAFNGDDRDASLFQQFKTGDCMIHRLRVYVAAVKEITGDEHEINGVRDGVIRNHVIPGTEKILRPLFQIITAATEVYVCHMEKSHMEDIIRAKGRIQNPEGRRHHDAGMNSRLFQRPLKGLEALPKRVANERAGVSGQEEKGSKPFGSTCSFYAAPPGGHPKIWIHIGFFG